MERLPDLAASPASSLAVNCQTFNVWWDPFAWELIDMRGDAEHSGFPSFLLNANLFGEGTGGGREKQLY